jgi:hypothetical protein
MRRPLLGWAAALAVLALAPSGRAFGQVGVAADPFSFYYGYYLPHQAYIAAQPRPLDTINQMVAQRQYTAQTDRSALYDPISPYGDEESDPLAPYSNKRGGERRAKPMTFSYGAAGSSNTNGGGPSLYYNRTARYFPTLRIGRGANRNIAAIRSSRGGMGGMGMSGGGAGMMPGPR